MPVTESDADEAAHKTRRWLDSLHDVAEAASPLPRKTRVIRVSARGREAEGC